MFCVGNNDGMQVVLQAVLHKDAISLKASLRIKSCLNFIVIYCLTNGCSYSSSAYDSRITDIGFSFERVVRASTSYFQIFDNF